MSITLRSPDLTKAFEECAKEWNDSALHQRKGWAMLANVPSGTPAGKAWDLLPSLSQSILFDYYTNVMKGEYA